jgi:hypothetical protein
VEPFPGADPGGQSLPRTGGRRSERHHAGRAGLEPASLIPLQGRTAPADRATGHREPPFGADPNRPLYRSGAAAVRGGGVRPPGLEPGPPSRELASRASASAIPPRAPESRHPGSNRAVRGTKAEPQAVRGGMAAHHGFEPRFAHSECAVLPVGRMGTGCGRRDSNAQTARFELARSSSCRHFRVRRRGFEPRLHGLRVRCSSQLS